MLKFLILTVFFVDYFNAEQCMDELFTCPDMVDLCSEPNIKNECPLTCGLCILDPNICADRNPDCPTFSFMCYKYEKQCPKTCGVCKGNTTVTPTVPPKTTIISTIRTTVPIRTTVLAVTVPQKTTVVPTTPARTTIPPQTTKTTVPLRTTVLLKTTVRTTVPPATTKTTKKPTPTTPKPPCKDASPNCPTWAKNGFCTNTFYPPETRKEYCAKTCKYC
ncbi:hypothetical protein L5515_012578 [Caenorhabditis briggsae]|uniref:ShKT domain-containing protein n=1 Tax=Caenorhabditis briggsae TaxID=6238 RepID=A0AAE9JHA1_CAEBR|nr:hypothetical protein L5515_012578 [Caenorhabditis briggsae]